MALPPWLALLFALGALAFAAGVALAFFAGRVLYERDRARPTPRERDSSRVDR